MLAGGEVILGVLQARVSSTRLPGKVLLPLLGKPMIARQIERIRRTTLLDGLVVATSTDADDDLLAETCDRLGVEVYRGSRDDVLGRFVHATQRHEVDHVVRLTGDCPLSDPELIDELIAFHLDGGYDYSSNCLRPSLPDGLDAEVIRFATLLNANEAAVARADREHVTQYVVKHPELFSIGTLENAEDLSEMRWTVDEPEDMEFVRRVYAELYPRNAKFSWRDVLALIREQPELLALNAGFVRNEGLALSEADDLRRL